MTTFGKWMVASVATLALGIPLAGLTGASARAADVPVLAARASTVYKVYWKGNLGWHLYYEGDNLDDAEDAEDWLIFLGKETYWEEIIID